MQRDMHTGPGKHAGPAAGPGGAARAPLNHLQQAAAGVRVPDQAVRKRPRGAPCWRSRTACAGTQTQKRGKDSPEERRERSLLLRGVKVCFVVLGLFCLCSDLSLNFDIEIGRISSPAAFSQLLKGDFPNLN